MAAKIRKGDKVIVATSGSFGERWIKINQAFGAVVVLTMFSALQFDPRLIWDPLQKERPGHE